MSEAYDAAVQAMTRWRAFEKWGIWTSVASPLLLFLLPLDKFLLGWFGLVVLVVISHCNRVACRQRADVISTQDDLQHASTDDSD